ncbi:MAG: hypothetical protein LUD17_11760 [Bacteroidales bacterium]|nr:hypothetical protein [Bacteroidales bacterium]
MKHLTILVLLAIVSTTANAQSITRLELGTRLDLNEQWVDGHYYDDGSGFNGQYLRFRIDGTILPNLKFVYRQRLNKQNSDASFFDSVDFMKLMYYTGRFCFIAGKDDVFVGNYENDRAAYDVYFYSDVWRQFANKEFGFSIGFNTYGDDWLEAQVGQSPFCRSEYNTSDSKNMYMYNLRYRLKRGILGAMLSESMFEYLPGKYINYLCLGLKLDIPVFLLEFDYVNRYTRGEAFFGTDYSVVANTIIRPWRHVHFTAKYAFDSNNTDYEHDYYVLRNTALHVVSAGIEYYPFRQTHDIRLHALGAYAWGRSPDTTYHQDHEWTIKVGITWIIDFYKLLKLERYFPKD